MAGTSQPDNSLREVRVHGRRTRDPDEYQVRTVVSKVPSRHTNYVYVNSAYVGSTNSVNGRGLSEPPTSVIREQYWACSRWPYGQRMLAIAVGVLLGAVIGLAVTIGLLGGVTEDGVGGLFRSGPAPD